VGTRLSLARNDTLRRPRRRTNPARRYRDGVDAVGELPERRWRIAAARVPEHAMRARADRDIEHGRRQVGRVKAARRLARDICGVERKKPGIRELLEEPLRVSSRHARRRLVRYGDVASPDEANAAIRADTHRILGATAKAARALERHGARDRARDVGRRRIMCRATGAGSRDE